MDRRNFLKLSLGGAGAVALGVGLGAPAVNGARRLIAHYDPRFLKITSHIDSRQPAELIRHDLIIKGLQKNGMHVEYGSYNVPTNADIAIVWLWAQENVINDARRRGAHLLAAERGFFSPRDSWITLAWDNYNGLGRFAPAPRGDNGARWDKYFQHLLNPWRKNESGYALLMGQRPDLFLRQNHIDNNAWAQNITNELIRRGQTVVYRPHPEVRRESEASNQAIFTPQGAVLSDVDLSKDLQGAGYCVTLCTNAAVETVLAGIPTISLSKASLAWPVTSHSLDEPFTYPDRLPWCHELAWRHWTFDEVQSGRAWRHIYPAMYNEVSA